MLFIVLFRILIFIWIFGILFVLIGKIAHKTLRFDRLGLWVFLLFPILFLSSKGRKKIKEEILK